MSSKNEKNHLLFQKKIFRKFTNSYPLTKVRFRRDGAFAVGLCRSAANALFEASGGGGLYERNPIGRAHRDMQAIAAHIAYQMNVAGTWYGRVALGLDDEAANL